MNLERNEIPFEEQDRWLKTGFTYKCRSLGGVKWLDVPKGEGDSIYKEQQSRKHILPDEDKQG